MRIGSYVSALLFLAMCVLISFSGCRPQEEEFEAPFMPEQQEEPVVPQPEQREPAEPEGGMPF